MAAEVHVSGNGFGPVALFLLAIAILMIAAWVSNKPSTMCDWNPTCPNNWIREVEKDGDVRKVCATHLTVATNRGWH